MPDNFDTSQSQLQNYLDQWILDRPISHWGLAKLERPLSFDFYKSWIDQGFHSTMNYLKDHLPIKENPHQLGSQLRSALVFAFPYLPHPEPHEGILKNTRIALYAQGKDYHFWIKDHLRELITDLKEKFPNEEFLVFTDSAPIMERDLGYRAGLGWIGKNTCLIHRQEGSLFFVAEVLTSLPVEVKIELENDFCGNCQACIEICPTEALTEPRKLNAGLCISYWTIESRDVPPTDIREKLGDWFFGCDLCQTVCPWNKKAFKNRAVLNQEKIRTEDSREELIKELRFILSSSGKTLTKTFHGSPLQRAGPFGLKRNAIIVAANKTLVELKEDIEKFLTHEKLASLAKWALLKLGSS